MNKIRVGEELSVRLGGGVFEGRVIRATKAKAGKQKFTIRSSDGQEKTFRCLGSSYLLVSEKVAA